MEESSLGNIGELGEEREGCGEYSPNTLYPHMERAVNNPVK